jgi:serine protease inhibitor
MSEGVLAAGSTRRRAVAALMVVSLAVGACAGSTSTTGPTPAMAVIEPGAKIAMGNAPLLAPAADAGVSVAADINGFGLDLLRRLDPTGNLVFSPTSIALALAMVRPGARGQTAAEMDKVLHSFGEDAEASQIVALLNSLDNPTVCGNEKSCELSVANAAFAQTGWPMEQPYLDALSSRFGAGVNLLDFRDHPDAAVQTTNDWVSEKTQGRITDLIQRDDVDPTTRLILVNAIYLKAAWAQPLYPAPDLLAFTRPDGSVVLVPKMGAIREIGYASDTGWRAVDMPYVGRLSMTIVVPDDMSTFTAGLDAAGLARIIDREQSPTVSLTMPRFSTKLEIDLSEKLAAMGMPTAFDPRRADLSGIDGATPPDLYVSKVAHAANIDVDEKGTTASAATAVIINVGGMGPEPTLTFNVDRPFLYFIRDTGSGAVLFMGRIDDPSAG